MVTRPKETASGSFFECTHYSTDLERRGGSFYIGLEGVIAYNGIIITLPGWVGAVLDIL